MRRVAIALATVALGAAGAVLMGAGGGSLDYRVDVIVDNASNLIPGQDVKIAGARAGTVKDVVLTPDRRARIEMEVQEGFAPFRADANCLIRPQSLIGEKFVQCDPGSPRAAPLRASGGHPPTVPIENTGSPVDLDLVFAALRRPYRERLSLIVNELGTGLAGRPRDLSQAIKRASPAFRELNEVLAILNRDRHTLGRLVEESDRAIAQLADRSGRVESFVERANSATVEVASRRGDLDAAIRELPPLLRELEPSADRLAALARDAQPLVRDLRGAAPELRTLLNDFGPLSRAGKPALERLASASRRGRAAVRAARPVAVHLRETSTRLPHVVRTATELVESLQRTGVVEGLQNFVYFGALATSRFDTVSHILPAYLLATSCQQYAETPTAGCSAHFQEPAAVAHERGPRGRRRRTDRAPASRPGPAPGPQTAPQPAPAPGPAPEPEAQRSPLPRLELPGLPETPRLPERTQIPLLDFLLSP